MIETRNQINGSYKGYIYCTGLEEAHDLNEKITVELNRVNLNNFKISIKHGCSEFYKSYPKFKSIDNEMKYNEEWLIKENLIDSELQLEIKKIEKFGVNICKD